MMPSTATTTFEYIRKNLDTDECETNYIKLRAKVYNFASKLDKAVIKGLSLALFLLAQGTSLSFFILIR